MKTLSLYIDGSWTEGHGEVIKKINPSDGTPVAKMKAATGAQVADAVSAARSALASWASRPIGERQALLEAFADTLRAEKDRLASVISLEIGKPDWEAQTEVQAMIGKVAISIDAFERRCSEFRGGPAVTRFLPHGVVAVLGPFNFPGHLPNGHIVPALLAGNTVVFKASELAPMTASLMMELWEKSGLPAGVLNLIHGGADSGRHLIENDDINGVYFTGSARVGEFLKSYFSTRPGKILALEMGGNNPLVVDEVEKIDAAVLIAIQSAFLTAGQRCTCARRLVVPEGDWGDHFLKKLVEKAGQIIVGAPGCDPVPFMGPVITEKVAGSILSEQENLLKQGANSLFECRLLQGGTGMLSPGIIDVSKVMHRSDEEIFGPLLQVIRVAGFDAAIEEANRTDFGLAAGLISDEAEKWNRFQREVTAGVMNWNQQTTGASSAAPFGGFGRSGNFRPGAYFAADYCSRPVAMIEVETLNLPESEPPGFTSNS